MAQKIGILTGGGDAPGLNAVIRGIVVYGTRLGYEFVGFLDGWAGVLNAKTIPLSLDDVEDIHRHGGTIIGTSRTPIFPKKKGDPDRSGEVVENLKKLEIYALIAIGGNDTIGEANQLYNDGKGEFTNIIGVPKTIDNDLCATDYTFGFNTAVNIATEAMDRLHTTTKAHHRVMIVEIMGRDAGWMTLEAGMAGGAHIILIPEFEFDFNEVCSIIRKRYESGKDYTIIAVAEGVETTELFTISSKFQGALDNKAISAELREEFKRNDASVPDGAAVTVKKAGEEWLIPETADRGYQIRKKGDKLKVYKVKIDSFLNVLKGGAGKDLEDRIQSWLSEEAKDLKPYPEFKFEARSMALGHLQRGGAPTAFDRVLCARFGIKAVELIKECKFGRMVSLQGTNIVDVSLKEAVEKLKTVPCERYEEARKFLGLWQPC